MRTSTSSGWKSNSHRAKPADQGVVPTEAARQLREHAAFTVPRILEIEREVRHDVIAFTSAVAETMKAKGVAEASRWFHYGMTSNDVVDTAQARQIIQSAGLIRKSLETLAASLEKRALEFRHTPKSAAPTAFRPNRSPSAGNSPSTTTKSAATSNGSTSPPNRSGTARSPEPWAYLPISGPEPKSKSAPNWA